MTAGLGRRALLGGLLAPGLVPGLALAQPAVRRITDGAGRRVAVPDRVAKVFPAGPPAAILLWSVAPDLLAGWTREPDPATLAFLPPEAAALPEVGRLTGRGDTANAEAVLASRPDLILDYGSVGATYSSLADRLQEQTGLPALLLDGTLARIPDTFRLLGEILERRKDAEAQAAAAEQLLGDARTAAEALRARGRPRVFYARGPRGTETGLAGSINTEIIEFCGAENVAASDAGGRGLGTVSPEQVLGWDPDWVIATDPRFAEAARADPVWSELRAVRRGQVVVAPTMPYGWVDFPPSVNRLLGLLWLPALFGGRGRDGFAGRVADLHALLFHHRPAEEQLAPILRAAFPA